MDSNVAASDSSDALKNDPQRRRRLHAETEPTQKHTKSANMIRNSESDRLFGSNDGSRNSADTDHPTDYGSTANLHNPNRNARTAIRPQLIAGYAANIGVHAILVGFTAFVTYLCFYRGIVLFSWHPPCMLLGFFILMTEAICCFIEPNIPTLGLNATLRKKLHWIMQCVAACSITVAFVVILLNKERIGKPHFATWHGLLGLLAIIAAGVSMLGGLFALYSVQWRRWLVLRPGLVRLLHSVAGVLAYGLGMVTIGFGCYSPFFAENATFQVQTVCAVLVALVGMYAVVMPLWKIYGRVKQLVASD